MTLVSVITPVYQPVPEFLQAAYNSLTAQNLPTGWEWEWIVQEDGETDALAGLLPDDPRISRGSGRRGGPGVARTLALSRAAGQLVKVLDADDQLTPGTLTRDITVLTEHPAIGWTTSRVLDLLPDGSTVGFDQDPPEGLIQRGAVLRHWLAHSYRAQVHPASLCIRRDLLLALGGWMALPASEDTGLLIAANTVSDGYFSAEPGLLYRKWSGQVTSQAAHIAETERAARMQVIKDRAGALEAFLRRNLLWGN
ncbi:glycosyltransferase family 2 protein [Streptosporangium sandarakinum]|uniref:glycosyltransferase family 2 protein n=1 Tax=Streptosporangium sandarakinum TaxID=1260955 RepID=UPI003715FFC5